jgi:threonine dehydrogenase-like Zn-dependent dehydrogenase
MPVILGHEFSGVVTSVGCDVKHLKQGDNVVVDPNRYLNDNSALISGAKTTNAMT